MELHAEFRCRGTIWMDISSFEANILVISCDGPCCLMKGDSNDAKLHQGDVPEPTVDGALPLQRIGLMWSDVISSNRVKS